MKKDDFIKRVLQEAGVDPKFLTFTEDVDDAAVATYATNLLTRERAEADPVVFGKIRNKAYAEALDGFDKDFVAFAEADLPKEVADKIKAEKVTRTKWDMLRAALPKPGSETEVVKTYKKEIEALHNNLKAKETEVATIKSESDGKLTEFQKSYLLAQEIAKLPIAETAKQFVNLSDIQTKFTDSISKKGILLEIENGSLSAKTMKDGAKFDHYTGNVKTTLPDLFKTELAAYLKQSSGGGNPPAPPNPGAPPQPVPAGGLTLQEMNAAKVKEKFAAMKQQ